MQANKLERMTTEPGVGVILPIMSIIAKQEQTKNS